MASLMRIRSLVVSLLSSALFATELMANSAADCASANDVGVFYPAGGVSNQKSLAFVVEPSGNGSRIPGWSPYPTFSVTPDGKSVATVAVPDGTSLYGEGEVRAPLLRNNTQITCWNTDNYLALGNDRPLYQSHPWVLGVQKDGTSFGVFADTTWRTTIDLQSGIRFTSDGPAFRVIVIREDSPQEVIKRMAGFTGCADLPALWTLGYHQCRYTYYPESQLESVAAGFRSRHIPCDTMWMDIDYQNGYRVFTFDPVGYSNPAGVYSYLHSNHFHAVNIIDPHVKVDPAYSIYQSGKQRGLWVLNKHGTEFQGDCWPGTSVWVDFTQPRARDWWAENCRQFLSYGGDGIWNDMNEPSVFNTPDGSGTMPVDNIHLGGGGLPQGPHARYHNVYGMLQSEASREGLLRAHPDRRPFVLTRASYMGGQRYAEMWCGDNASEWDYLQGSIPTLLNVGMSLEPFGGADIGGFVGTATPEIWARWVGVGAFYPFCRGHAVKGSPPKEPWEFGPAVEAEARTALQRRYRLLPYLYTLFREASVDGMPVVRPVFFADPKDFSLRSEQEAFLLGGDLLVVPHLGETSQRTPSLPKGIWQSVSLVGENPSTDINQPDLRVRGGAIIPAGPIMEYTGEKKLDPLTLIVSLNERGEAVGRLYEDDGDGFAYRQGFYSLTEFKVRKKRDKFFFSMRNAGGRLEQPPRTIEIMLLDENGSQSFQITTPSRGEGGIEEVELSSH
jgi:alpha-glucosidase